MKKGLRVSVAALTALTLVVAVGCSSISYIDRYGTTYGPAEFRSTLGQRFDDYVAARTKADRSPPGSEEHAMALSGQSGAAKMVWELAPLLVTGFTSTGRPLTVDENRVDSLLAMDDARLSGELADMMKTMAELRGGCCDYRFEQVYSVDEELLGVTSPDPEHVWVVGGRGDSEDATGVIYFYDGVSWSMQFETAGKLRDVCAVDPHHAWAVGDRGVFFFDGSSWEKQYDTGIRLYGVSATDPARAWAVGKGAIFAFDGSGWEMQYDAGGVNLFGVSALDERHVWAAGNAIYYFGGSSWAPQFESPEPLRAVSAISIDNAVAVGVAGGFFVMGGHAWNLLSQLGSIELLGVGALDGSNIWAVGSGGGLGQVQFFDGYMWSLQYEADEGLTDVSSLDTNSIWVVGGNGGVYRGRRAYMR